VVSAQQGRHQSCGGEQTLTIAIASVILIVHLGEFDGNPKQINNGVPSLGCDTLTYPEDATDEGECEPALEPGEGG